MKKMFLVIVLLTNASLFGAEFTCSETERTILPVEASTDNYCEDICAEERQSCSLGCNQAYPIEITLREQCYSRCRTSELRCLQGC